MAAVQSHGAEVEGALVDCLAAGDSLIVGLAPYLHGCTINAKVGISSAAIIQRVGNTKLLIVSAGSNDPYNPRLEANLKAIRAKANKVIWIVPQNRRAAQVALSVARFFGDSVVTFTPSRDGIHPKSYGVLAESVRRHM